MFRKIYNVTGNVLKGFVLCREGGEGGGVCRPCVSVLNMCLYVRREYVCMTCVCVLYVCLHFSRVFVF